MEFDPLTNYVPIWIRFLFGCSILVLMAWSDWKKKGANATRYKEYLFLIASAFIAIGFAEIHDAITVRISPAYFAEGKGLGWPDLNWNVAKLAVSASYWMGLALGLLYLIANNPIRRVPQLSYSVLYKLMGLPICFAVLFAPAFGVWFRLTVRDLEPNFAFVWGIHNGTYLGAAVGALVGIGLIVKRRRALVLPRFGGHDFGC